MNKHNLYTDCMKQNNVFHNSLLKVFVEHCVTAVFYNDGFSNPLLKVRHCLNKNI